MAEGRRADRLSRQLRAELAAIIDQEIDDPRVGSLVITRVRLSRDLGHATVYVHSAASPTERESQVKCLNSAQGFLRRQLSSRLAHLRRVPELRFEFDRSAEAGMRVEELLAEMDTDSTEPGEPAS